MSAMGELMEEENDQEYVDDDSETVSGRTYHLLKAEFEKCRQQVHDLRRKVCLDEAMLRELQEANESLERSLGRQVSEKEQILLDLEEKHRAVTKEYESTVRSLERTVTDQAAEMEQLRRNMRERKEQDCTPIIMNQSANITLEEDNVFLRTQIDQLLLLLEEEKEKYEQTIEELKNQCTEHQDISRIVKEQLAEKSKALEDARAELILKHGETVSVKAEPGHDFSKGNSLFAEVEDRRRCMMGKMNALREKYAQVKRVCQAQAVEIKSLRTERASTLEKWENDAVHTFAETDQLIQKHKNRISDLETKLKFEIKKNDHINDRTNPNDASFGYFQSLLDTKKKEMDELRIKIEDLSTQLLVQEETKINIAKQLRYWRYKASSLEAQMFAGNIEPKSNRSNDKFVLNHEDDQGDGDDDVRITKTQNNNLNDRKSESDEKAAAARIGKIEIRESECIKEEENTLKLPTKMLRFAQDTNTEDKSGKFQKPTTTAQIKYPMVYVNTTDS